jgi:hypothetical protein
MQVKATELSPVFQCRHNVLRDGTFLTRVSVQRRNVYVMGLHPTGRVVRRRYRHDQLVEVTR